MVAALLMQGGSAAQNEVTDSQTFRLPGQINVKETVPKQGDGTTIRSLGPVNDTAMREKVPGFMDSMKNMQVRGEEVEFGAMDSVMLQFKDSDIEREYNEVRGEQMRDSFCAVQAILLILSIGTVVQSLRHQHWEGAGNYCIIGLVTLVTMYLFYVQRSTWIQKHARNAFAVALILMMLDQCEHMLLHVDDRTFESVLTSVAIIFAYGTLSLPWLGCLALGMLGTATAFVSAAMSKQTQGVAVWIYVAYFFAVMLAYGGERSWRRVFVRLKGAEQERVGDERMKYVATTSHDLRTPMNAFQMGLDMLAEGGLSEGEARNVVGVMQEAASIMANTIDNLLLYSRTLTKCASPAARTEPVNLVDLFKVCRLIVLSYASGLSNNHGEVDVKLDICPSLPQWVATDPHRVKQMAINLLTNARKFTRSSIILKVFPVAHKTLYTPNKALSPGLDHREPLTPPLSPRDPGSPSAPSFPPSYADEARQIVEGAAQYFAVLHQEEHKKLDDDNACSLHASAASKRGAMVRVEVWDDGPGVSEEEKGRLFKAFTQLQEELGQGTGLGLFSLKIQCRALGGSFGVIDNPNPGGGSIFFFEVPLVATEAPSPTKREKKSSLLALLEESFLRRPSSLSRSPSNATPVPGISRCTSAEKGIIATALQVLSRNSSNCLSRTSSGITVPAVVEQHLVLHSHPLHHGSGSFEDRESFHLAGSGGSGSPPKIDTLAQAGATTWYTALNQKASSRLKGQRSPGKASLRENHIHTRSESAVDYRLDPQVDALVDISPVEPASSTASSAVLRPPQGLMEQEWRSSPIPVHSQHCVHSRKRGASDSWAWAAMGDSLQPSSQASNLNSDPCSQGWTARLSLPRGTNVGPGEGVPPASEDDCCRGGRRHQRNASESSLPVARIEIEDLLSGVADGAVQDPSDSGEFQFPQLSSAPITETLSLKQLRTTSDPLPPASPKGEIQQSPSLPLRTDVQTPLQLLSRTSVSDHSSTENSPVSGGKISHFRESSGRSGKVWGSDANEADRTKGSGSAAGISRASGGEVGHASRLPAGRNAPAGPLKRTAHLPLGKLTVVVPEASLEEPGTSAKGSWANLEWTGGSDQARDDVTNVAGPPPAKENLILSPQFSTDNIFASASCDAVITSSQAEAAEWSPGGSDNQVAFLSDENELPQHPSSVSPTAVRNQAFDVNGSLMGWPSVREEVPRAGHRPGHVSEMSNDVAVESRRQVLVADDVALTQKLMKKMLTMSGHDVEVASNGLQALNAMKKRRFSLVLMDLMMPVMDGFEAVETYRQWEKEARPGFRQMICALTANAREFARTEERTVEVGMDAFISKPFRKDDLMRILADCPAIPSDSPP